MLVEWFEFTKKCSIHSCKFNTDRLETGCLAIERKDTLGKKLLTDRELCYYKFNNDIPLQSVTALRKHALCKTKKIISLYYYVQFVQNQTHLLQIEPTIEATKLLTKFPVRLKKLNITPVLLANLLIESNFEKFKTKKSIDESYKMNDLFLIHSSKWSQQYYTKVEKYE